MKKTIKVVNPGKPKRKRNPLLIQSPFRRIKKHTSYTTKNPGEKRVSSNSLTKRKEAPIMAAKKHHRKHRNPVVFANKRRHVTRHKNPEGGVQFNGAGITSVLVDGLIVGGSMVGVNWLTGFISSKLFPDSSNAWMKYALMAAVSLLGGWAIGKANARVGKDFAAAGVGLTILNIANEQLTFLKAPTTLKGDEDGPVLGELTLQQLAAANAFKDNLLGAGSGPFIHEMAQGDEDDLSGVEFIAGEDELEGSAAFTPGFVPGIAY